MCGICGIYHFNNTKVEKNTIKAMLNTLTARGPDFEDDYYQNHVGLGHRRLAVIDLSEKANQPMVDQQLGLTIVFNGAIYNYPQLRKQLQDKGYSFFSHGDTEVIIKAYKEWGEDCVNHLDGMFAFAIWDISQQQLFLARDRLGIKPLYYSGNNERFAFASNMQALLTLNDVDKSIDAVGLHFQLSLHAVIPAPNTILQGIKKLKPGSSVVIKSDHSLKEKQYWNLPYETSADKLAWQEQQWSDAIEEKLCQAIKKRMDIADVPVGVLLSGGLDSSLLVALLAQHGAKDLRTFSIGFSDIGEERGSEFEFSDQIVERYQTQHQKIIIPNQQVLNRLPEAIAHMAEPMVGQDAVAFYLLSEQVAKQVKVVQSGQGADELFAGYFWFPLMQQAVGSELEKFSQYYFDRDHHEFLNSVTPKYQQTNYSGEYVADYFSKLSNKRDFLSKVLHLDVSTLVVDDPVKRVDNMTMAWGLEARVPFLDSHLVELAMQMPSQYKLGEHGGKQVLKNIARGKIPDAVIDRPKGYFPMPALKYVRGEFLTMMSDVLLSQPCRERGLFNPQYVQQLIKNPENPENMTRLQGSKLWHMALLELWLQEHL